MSHEIIHEQNEHLSKQAERCLAYVYEQGFYLPSEEDLHTFSEGYIDALHAGMEGKEASGLDMADSHIEPIPFHELPEGKQALVLVIGGTNLRASLVSVGVGKTPLFTRDPETSRSRYAQTNVPKSEFPEGPEKFYQAMVHELKGFLDGVDPSSVSSIGIIYSFKGRPVGAPPHLDMFPDAMMGKGFIVPGIDQVLVGKSMLETPELQKFQGIDGLVVMNDMPPVCVAAESKLGMILATGLNIGVAIKGKYHVTECGHFELIPSNRYADEVDRNSNNVGFSKMEKQTSGRYLGDLFGRVVDDLIAQSYLDLTLPSEHKWISEQVGLLASDPNASRGFSTDVKETLRAMALLTTKRASKYIGDLAGSTIKAFPDEFDTPVVRVPAEGALLWKIAGFHDEAQKCGEQRSGKQIEFVNIEHSDILGTGIVALHRNG